MVCIFIFHCVTVQAEKFRDKFTLILKRVLVLIEANLKNWSPDTTADISRRYHWFPRETKSEEGAQKFHTDDVSLSRSGQ